MHLLALQGRQNKPKKGKSAKYHAKSIPHEVEIHLGAMFGPSCTNSPQKLQVEVHCVGPESLETLIMSTQNNYFDIMHFGNHAFCVNIIAGQ